MLYILHLLKKLYKTAMDMVFIGFIIGIMGCIIVFLYYNKYAEDIVRGKNFSATDLPFPIILEDRNGVEIYRTFGTINREWIDLQSVPDSLIESSLIAEDKRFYHHFGIDPVAIVRAMIVNYKAQTTVQGASTITQQVARKVFLTGEKTMDRKLREVFLSLGLEMKYTKPEILELYFNTAPYGARLYGVKSAAKEYFNKAPYELTNAESMVLSVLPQSPVELTKLRYVSSWMSVCSAVEVQYRALCYMNNTPSRLENILYERAIKNNWTLQYTENVLQEMHTIILPEPHNYRDDLFHQWYNYIIAHLKKHNIDAQTYKGGLKIRTTIDAELQKQAYEKVSTYTEKLIKDYDMENVALVIIDNTTRQPVIYMGSKAFWDESIDGQVDILRSKRQPGSAIKPLLYYKYIADGNHPQSFIADSPIKYKGDKRSVQNWDGRFYGNMTVEKALVLSRNIPATRVFYSIGGEETTRTLLNDTFKIPINTLYKDTIFGWALALGAVNIDMLDLANAYTTLANGDDTELCPIISMHTITNKELPIPCNDASIELSDSAVEHMWNILSNKNIRQRGDVYNNVDTKHIASASKSGTSTKRINNVLYPVDNVLAGYTKDFTVLVWGGNTDGSALKRGSFASLTVAPLWRDMVLWYDEKKQMMTMNTDDNQQE